MIIPYISTISSVFFGSLQRFPTASRFSTSILLEIPPQQWTRKADNYLMEPRWQFGDLMDFMGFNGILWDFMVT
jgi:hypothetical protein